MFVEFLPLLMFAVLMLLVFTSYPIGFVLGGVAVLFGILGWQAGVFSLIEFFNFLPRIWMIADNFAIIAVPLFVFMGVMLERSEIAKDLLETLQILLRRVPGGMAMAVTVMATIFAAITGVVGASVVVMTLIALPPMLRAGYRPSLALGTIAASSTLGILIPPSILLVFLAELLPMSIGMLFAAALYPGLLLSGLYLLYIGVYTMIVPEAAPRLPAQNDRLSGAEIFAIFIRGVLPPVVLISMVLGSILTGFVTITESAAVGAAGAMVLALARGKLNLATLTDCLRRSAMMIGMIFFLFIGATCFSYVFRVLGGDELILALVSEAGLSNWGILVVAILLIFVMGFFFDVLEILLVVVPVFAPLVALLDFGGHVPQADVIYWFAVLVAVTLQTSFLTPPMGLALFYVKGVSPESVTMSQIYVGIIPFVILQLTCVGLVMAFPDIAMWLPHRLFD
ncbi:MAG: C4-dicarboxylate ABC transporter [Acidiferrobacteraceae bacterium]|nr:C4-dicarboxylate ABC transporter [Acidiferrobacteraceae bacterium]MDP6134921.1 TRAP transporter large permease subunit [Arenicellales bacterium]